MLNLLLDQRPTLDLTDKEALDMYHASPTGIKKIIKNQARWAGYAEIAEALKQGYDDYLRDIFNASKAKAKK